MSYQNFREELRKLINCEGMDARVGCPDYVLAEYLFGCTVAFKAAIAQNTPTHKWFPGTPGFLDLPPVA
jgi:hypothetical protein